jgi:hypothetical protein
VTADREREEEEWKPTVNSVSQSELFAPCEEIRVLAPTSFPKPTNRINGTAAPIVEPTHGQHRPAQDAVLAYAEGYNLPYYMMFLETLKETGFTGDVVLAIAEQRIVQPDVVDYLRTYTHEEGAADHPPPDDEMNVIVYQLPLVCEGRDGDLEPVRRMSKAGSLDIFQMCQLHNVYGWKDASGQVIGVAEDPRAGRVVATLRYEWYWIWSLRYQPHSWLMLLDARDSFFQSDPFVNLPRDTNDSPDGYLYFYGENPDATRLGKSRKNMKWILNGYGEATLEALKDKPTICSGSTLGEQIAIETYLRAMVNEHDECRVRMTGSDQGFHNYLYYSSKLTNAGTIRSITVWEQGRGLINNLGALRTKPLSEWGMYDEDTHEVFQWDGATLSPVVHQWDRDKALHSWMHGQRHREWNVQWNDIKERKAKERDAR